MLIVRPTIRGKIMTFAGVVAFLAAIVNPNPALYITSALIISIVLAGFVLSFFSLHKIEITGRNAYDSILGGNIYMPVTIENKASRRRQAIIISEKCPFFGKGILNVAVPSLSAKEIRNVIRFVPAERRGIYSLSQIKLIGGDPAGLFFREKKWEFPIQILIEPASVRISYIPLKLRNQILTVSSGRPIGISGAGQELFGIREYRSSDGVRFINWKATAKYGKPMVKEFESQSVSQLNLILDVNRKDIGEDTYYNNFEYLICVSASIVNYIAGMYCRFQFLTAQEKDRTIFIEGDAYSVKSSVMRTLAALQGTEFDFIKLLTTMGDRLLPNSILYCLSLTENKGIHTALKKIVDRGVEVRWISAPKRYFPVIDPEIQFEPEHPTPNKQTLKGISPMIATRQTDITKLLANT